MRPTRTQMRDGETTDRKAPRRPSWKLWAAAGGVILLGSIGFVVWLGPPSLIGSESTQEGGPAERVALITFEDLGLEGFSTPEYNNEHCTRQGKRSLLGYIALNYIFVGFSLQPRETLRISSKAYLFDYRLFGGPKMLDALWSSASTNVAEQAKRDFADSKSITVQMLEDWQLGDESMCALVFEDEKPAGFYFSCRVDLRLLNVSVKGMGFADSAAAKVFLAPQVAEFKAYAP